MELPQYIPMDPSKRVRYATGEKIYISRVLQAQGAEHRKEINLRKIHKTATAAFQYSKAVVTRHKRLQTVAMAQIFLSPKNLEEMAEV